MIFRNAVEFADWIGAYDVPGSKGMPELVRRGQIRVFSKDVKSRSVIKTITLESFDNHVAPTLIAITAKCLAMRGFRFFDQRDPQLVLRAPASCARSHSRVPF